MKVQSNRIKANRKPASTENQESRGVDNEIEPEPEKDGNLIRQEGGSFYLLETGEGLEELTDNGLEELLMSKGGRFFLRGKTGTRRHFVYNDKEITHAEARKWMFDNIIPSQMWEDFTQHPSTVTDSREGFEAFNNLETSVYQASAALFLVSNWSAPAN